MFIVLFFLFVVIKLGVCTFIKTDVQVQYLSIDTCYAYYNVLSTTYALMSINFVSLLRYTYNKIKFKYRLVSQIHVTQKLISICEMVDYEI